MDSDQSNQTPAQTQTVIQYRPVAIALFRSVGKDINFDIFLKLSDANYAHVFSQATGIDFQRLNHYRDKGVKNLFIRLEDEGRLQAFLQNKPEQVIADPKASSAKKVAALLDLSDQHLSEIFNTVAVPSEAATSATQLIKNFIKVIGDNPKLLSTMLRMASYGDYLYYHSLSVSVFSIFIAKATGQANQKLLEICGLGGLLHDVGYTQLPQDLLDSPTVLTPAQWREMRQHTNYGVKMVEGIRGIPDEVRFIIAQHHEEPRGTGYPVGMRGPVIFYPAKIVALADAFCALISKRPYRDAYTVDQALDIIKHENGKWDADLIRVLVGIFHQTKKAAA